MYGARFQEQPLPFSPGDGYDRRVPPVWLFEYEFASGELGEQEGYRDSLLALQDSFYGSNWRTAKLPSDVRRWLEANQPVTTQGQDGALPCGPR